MYKEHTQHYDKDKIVASTRRFLCGELNRRLIQLMVCRQQTHAVWFELRDQLNVAEMR